MWKQVISLPTRRPSCNMVLTSKRAIAIERALAATREAAAIKAAFGEMIAHYFVARLAFLASNPRPTNSLLAKEPHVPHRVHRNRSPRRSCPADGLRAPQAPDRQRRR